MGGSDRVTLTWADGAIKNQWLELRAKTGTQTGLSTDDVFYFGNVIGETGDSAADFLVTANDQTRVRVAVTANAVGVTSIHDIDRDGWVNSTDVTLVRLNTTTDLTKQVRVLDLR